MTAEEAKALVTELEEQRNIAFTRCLMLARQLATVKAERDALQAELDNLKDKPE